MTELLTNPLTIIIGVIIAVIFIVGHLLDRSPHDNGFDVQEISSADLIKVFRIAEGKRID